MYKSQALVMRETREKEPYHHVVLAFPPCMRFTLVRDIHILVIHIYTVPLCRITGTVH